MRSILFFLSLSFCSLASAHTFYVQDRAYNENASDINRGDDINRPWATWQKAFNTARAGDTVYFRGGTWYPTTDNYGNVTEHHPSIGRGHNGTPSNPICFLAYPPDVAEGNIPILDCRSTHPRNADEHVGLKIREARYLKFKGLKVTNVRSFLLESGSEMWCAGILTESCHHLTLENMTVSYTGGPGFFMWEHDTLYLKNCDAHNNCDSLDLWMPGGDGDGFHIKAGGEVTDTSRITYISGCRAWNNSDDGFDIESRKQLDVNSCWSWNNGYLEGDATGFKIAHSHLYTSSKRRIYNCIAAYNDVAGFTDLNLHYSIGPFMQYLNNSVYKCGHGYGSGPGDVFNCELHPASVIYRNNIIYAHTGAYPSSLRACHFGYPTYVTQDHNTWVQTGESFISIYNPEYQISDDDFISLDSAQLKWPRKADGSLPDITFMRLKCTGDLFEGGVDVGLPYNGNAPELGAFECSSFSVDLISPAGNQGFVIGSEVNLLARVDGIIDDVDEVNFYTEDGVRVLLGLGEKISPTEWQLSWESDELGYQSFRAVATSSQGEVATSSLVRVLVRPETVPGSEGECRIMPNPNDGTFVLQLNEPLNTACNIQIVSMSGQLVANQTMDQKEISKEFDLSALGAGFYNLVFENGEYSSPCRPLKIIKY